MEHYLAFSASQIIGLWVEALFVGFYLVSCGFALRAFLWHSDGGLKGRSEINWILFITAIFLCIVAVLNEALGLLQTLQPGSTSVSDWIRFNVMNCMMVLIQMILGGGMLIYQCWIMYSKALDIVIIPLSLLLGDIVVFAITVTKFHDNEPNSVNILFTVFCAASTALNILTTTLIVIRIWWVERENSRFVFHTGSAQGNPMPRKKTRLGKIMQIIIESGLIITLTSLVFVTTSLMRSYSAYAASGVLVQNIGIALNLIVIRARVQPADEYTLHPTNALSAPGFPISTGNITGGNPDLGQQMSLNHSSLDEGKGSPRQHTEFQVDHALHEDYLIHHIDSRHELGHGNVAMGPSTPGELVAGPTGQPASTAAAPEAVTPVLDRGAEYIEEPEQQTALMPAGPDAGVWVPGAATTPSPLRLSLTNLDTEHLERSPTRTGPLYSAPPSAYRQTHRLTASVGASTRSGGSRPLTAYTDSMYPESTLPSYPGTVRSASPPGYSDLSRTRSERTAGVGGSDRGVSVYTESVGHGGPTAGLENLGEWRGDA